MRGNIRDRLGLAYLLHPDHDRRPFRERERPEKPRKKGGKAA